MIADAAFEAFPRRSWRGFLTNCVLQALVICGETSIDSRSGSDGIRRPSRREIPRNNETRWNTFSFVWAKTAATCPFDSRRNVDVHSLADNTGRATFKGIYSTQGRAGHLLSPDIQWLSFGQLFLVALKQWYLPNQFNKACMVDADCWAGAVCDAANNRCLAQMDGACL